ncbi:MAG TPA: hypothetical protein VM266_16195 [Solirubrobacteraceae bacterium]|nr:hypothetical protein [Solirubrobacteraceae bacterium]
MQPRQIAIVLVAGAVAFGAAFGIAKATASGGDASAPAASLKPVTVAPAAAVGGVRATGGVPALKVEKKKKKPRKRRSSTPTSTPTQTAPLPTTTVQPQATSAPVVPNQTAPPTSTQAPSDSGPADEGSGGVTGGGEG